MLTNKYIQLALSLAIVLCGAAAAFDWSDWLSPEAAGAIAGGLGVIKTILNLLGPAPGSLVRPTGGAIVNHTTA